MALDSIVDLDRYPIHEPGGTGFQSAVAEARAGLADDGCSVFVRSEAAAIMAAEGERLRGTTVPVERAFWPPTRPMSRPPPATGPRVILGHAGRSGATDLSVTTC